MPSASIPASRRCAAAWWSQTERPCHGEPSRQCAGHPRAPRPRDKLPQLAERGGAAHADEQPRRRGGGTAAGTGGVRRHRPGGAQLGGVRPHRRRAARAGAGGDAAGAVGQAGGRVPHPRRRAARADRQLQPGAALGHLGQVQRTRPHGVDDVRPDDGRLVDLHRHARHHPGHLRDLRRDWPPPLRRHPEGQMDSHRRAGRHGRRAAAGRDHGRRQLAGGGVPAEPDREAARHRLPGPHHRQPR